MVDVPTVGVDPNVGAGVLGISPSNSEGAGVGVYVLTTLSMEGNGVGGMVLLKPSGTMGIPAVGKTVSSGIDKEVGGSVSLGKPSADGDGVGCSVDLLHMSTYSQRPFIRLPTATFSSQHSVAEEYDMASAE